MASSPPSFPSREETARTETILLTTEQTRIGFQLFSIAPRS
jgi:hypothetical protein